MPWPWRTESSALRDRLRPWHPDSTRSRSWRWRFLLTSARRWRAALLASLDDPADPAEMHEAWTTEIESRVDDIVSGRVQAIPNEEVKRQLAERRAARQTARQG